MLAYPVISFGSFSACYNLVAACTAELDMAMLLHIISLNYCYNHRKAQLTSPSGHV